ncbi:hypothetical protein HDV03_002014 [Kappamyces sp. JEL0829]|nr:hypothetical protein HDV03_002014 [Kappamyces sp. JEL0829]
MNARLQQWLAKAVPAVKTITTTYCVLHLLSYNVVSIGFCEGPSMLPTFNVAGDIVLVDMFAWKYRGIPWGSIIVFTSPENPEKRVTKRVIGLPGDTILVDPTNRASPRKSITIPEGHVWTQGDNYDYSNDSRSYGPLPMGLIKGRVVARLAWPPQILDPLHEPSIFS